MIDLLLRLRKWACAFLSKLMSPFEKQDRKPEKPDIDAQILQVLILILEATGRQNKILRTTEANNERRHKELLAALGSQDATKVVYTKVRREPIT